jgi:hypothetical protein
MGADKEVSGFAEVETSIVPQQPDLGAHDDDHWHGGGPWTEIKLDAVMYFVECYTRALTPAGFDLWYIDAAGSGGRKTEHLAGGLFEGQPLELVTVACTRFG